MIHTYLERGWHVFPIKAGAKIPLTPHGCNDATNNHDQVEAWQARWPRCNWGLACGPSHLLVIDLDGADGLRNWLTLTAQHEPDTLASRTGSGGLHLVYHDPHNRGRNSASLLAPNVDTRGRGGYIVAPPSLHPSGTPYQWIGDATLAPAPKWVLDKLDPPERPITPPALIKCPALDCDRYAEVTLDNLQHDLATAASGRRNSTLNRAAYTAGKLVRDGHAPPHTVTFLRDLALSTGLPRREVEATWDSGYTAGYSA